MTKINVGLRLPATQPTNPLALRAFIAKAEELGFHSIWAGDHVFYHQDVPQCLHMLTWVAGMTQRVRIGTSVMLSAYLNPVLIAKAAATVDCLSGGRLTLGMSIGGTEAEYRSIGVPMNQRVGRFLETVRIMRMLWQAEGNVTFEGRYNQLVDANIRPHPAQAGGVPIFFGAASEPMMQRLARRADGWVSGSSATPEQFLERAGKLRRMAEEAGRPADALGFVKQHNVSVDPDRERAYQRAMEHFGRYYGPRYRFEEALGYGTVDDVAQHLQRFQTSDVPEITLALEPATLDLDHLERLWEASAAVRS